MNKENINLINNFLLYVDKLYTNTGIETLDNEELRIKKSNLLGKSKSYEIFDKKNTDEETKRQIINNGIISVVILNSKQTTSNEELLTYLLEIIDRLNNPSKKEEQNIIKK